MFFQVKEANLSSYCKCAGRFQTTISVEKFAHKMLTFRNIARYSRDVIEVWFEFVVPWVLVTPTMDYFQYQVLSWKIEADCCMFFLIPQFISLGNWRWLDELSLTYIQNRPV